MFAISLLQRLSSNVTKCNFPDELRKAQSSTEGTNHPLAISPPSYSSHVDLSGSCALQKTQEHSSKMFSQPSQLLRIVHFIVTYSKLSLFDEFVSTLHNHLEMIVASRLFLLCKFVNSIA